MAGSLAETLAALPSVPETLRRAALPVYLYGTGDGAEKILKYLLRNGIRPSGVFASDGFVRDRVFCGYRVEALADVEAREGKFAAVLCFGLAGAEAISLLGPLSKRQLLLAPAVPVYGDGMLNRQRLLVRAAELERVYGWLSDARSRRLFLDVLHFQLTGDVSRLLSLPDPADAAAPDGYLSHDLDHVDVGAYDGDTVREYLAQNPRCRKVLAFEPDPSSFRRLTAGTDPARVTCFCAACGERDGGSVRFAAGRGRGSHVSPDGTPVPVRSLDAVCGYPFIGSDGRRIGSLKIDAEGEDAAVLCGAANLITACRPSVCVSAYHRAEDLLDLPLLLKRLDYRSALYFRKKPYVPAWDTAFYLIPT